MNERLLIAYLSHKINLTLSKLKRINSYYLNLEEALQQGFQKLENEKLINKFRQTLPNFQTDIADFENSLKKENINYITYFEEGYPKILKHIDDPPLVLYYQGNLDNVKIPELITVVGSRKTSASTEMILNTILRPCCEVGIGVVSGLALGVDTLTHRICLETGSKTVAVIGSGLDDKSFYPYNNLNLKKQIIESGSLVMSEYPPGTPASNYTFPRRNRILAGLTKLTWMVQAGKKSGALITVEYARKQNKLVATTPGSVFDSDFQGNVDMIRQGSEVIVDREDIFRLMGLHFDNQSLASANKENNTLETLDSEEKKIYENLSISPKVVDDVAQEVGFQVIQVSSILTMLELKGVVNSVGENKWVKAV
jgi:DNA processing protein